MLENIDKTKNPFKIPENYFENLSNDIMDKLPEKKILPAKKVPLWKKVLPWTAAAAVFCGIIFTTGVLDKNTTRHSSISDISSSIEEDYYLFLEEEVTKNEYKEMIYDNY